MINKNIESEIVFHIIQVADELRRKGDNITSKAGITTQQWLILLHLANDPNIYYLQKSNRHQHMLAKELAESFNISRAGITNLINVLLRKKLVKQDEDSKDKRKKRLTLTEEGWAIIKELEPVRWQFNNRLFRDISEADKQAIGNFLKSTLNMLNIHFLKQ
jgi:DNA-binding MarR family transcriptional regulator